MEAERFVCGSEGFALPALSLENLRGFEPLFDVFLESPRVRSRSPGSVPKATDNRPRRDSDRLTVLSP